MGISEKIKRICGASAGAIVGTLLAIGYDSKKLKEFLNQDIEKILIGKKELQYFLPFYLTLEAPTPQNGLNVFDHFVGLAFKGLKSS